MQYWQKHMVLAAICAAFSFAAASSLAAEPEISISIKDRHFVPDLVTAPAGQKLKIIVKNEDTTTSEFESIDFHREKVVQPGHEITVYVGPLDAGSYEFFDDFHPESRGRLVVK
ncbi:MAG TPA: cupredoxin domain-containing protein [Burkholderiaceae bacterium]|nr:cupredoxin domain-containing protein [Burkholderiaceae bacterium]